MAKPDAPQDTPGDDSVVETAHTEESVTPAETVDTTGDEATEVGGDTAGYPEKPERLPSNAGSDELDGADDSYAADSAESDEATEAVQKQDNKPVKFAMVGLAVGIIVGSCFNYAVTGVQEMVRSANATAITAAVSDCNVEDRDGVTVTDNGKRLTIDTKGPKEEKGASSQNAVCLIQSLNVPTEVIQKLDSTKTGAERQSTKWEKHELAWEFTESDGIKMDLTILPE